MSDTENAPDEPIVTTQTLEKSKKSTDSSTKPRRQPPYNVILLNDEEHTFDYVIELLMKLFAHAKPTAEALTYKVHKTGKAIVFTTHRELAELKREQVLAYGPDHRMSISKGPIGCDIEAAE